MKPRAAVLLLGLPSLLGALSACQLGRPIEEQHPSVQRAEPSADDSTEAKQEALARTAGADLACQRIDVVLTLERRYANTAAARYVVEGCGTRALYAETCEAYPSCRYLLLSTVALPRAQVALPIPSAAPTSSASPAPPGSAPAAPAASAAPAAPTSPAASAAPVSSAPPRFL